MSEETLVSIRLQLADAKHELRLAQDLYHADKLRAEISLIEQAGPKGLGSNEAERKRAFEAVVAGDPSCIASLEALREAQLVVDRLEAAVDDSKDALREREIESRS